MTAMPELDCPSAELPPPRRRRSAGVAALRERRPRALRRIWASRRRSSRTGSTPTWRRSPAQAFRLPDDASPPADVAALAAPARLATGIELVFVNGRFAAQLSSPARCPQGSVVTSLAAALRDRSRADRAAPGPLRVLRAGAREPDRAEHCVRHATAPSSTCRRRGRRRPRSICLFVSRRARTAPPSPIRAR